VTQGRNLPRRRHQQHGRPRPPQPAPLDALLEHYATLIGQLAVGAALIGDYQHDPQTLFDLRELAEHSQASLDFLREYLDQLLAAEQLARAGTPLSTRYGTGGLWAGRQLPRHVLRLAHLAPAAAATTTYLDGYRDAALAQKVQTRCGLANTYGLACVGWRVRLPDGSRARACWPHLSEDEKAAVTAARDAIIANRHCPTCHAGAGQPCTEDGTPTSIHNKRLRAGCG
jgi:hypothetical protein